MKGMIAPADAVRGAEEGKISALGAFWTAVQAGTQSFQLIMLVRLELEEEVGVEHSFEIDLCSSGEKEKPLMEASGFFTIEANADHNGLMPLGAFPIETPSLELRSGLFEWVLAVDGKELDTWPFEARAGEPPVEDTE